MKIAIHNLIGMALISVDSILIVTILILLIQEHGISFYLFVSSSIVFISIL